MSTDTQNPVIPDEPDFDWVRKLFRFRQRVLRPVWLGLCSLCTWVLPLAANAPAPVCELQASGAIPRWLLLGPFPNEKTAAPQVPGDSTNPGLQTDFLSTLGGETAAEIKPDTAVTHAARCDGTARVVTVQPNNEGVVDLLDLFSDKPNSVVYAFCQIEVKTPQPIHLFIGHTDGAKVWLNGTLLHQFVRKGGKVLKKRQHQLTGQLEAGTNRLLLKFGNRGPDWKFHLEAFDAAGMQLILEENAKEAAARKAAAALQACSPRPSERWDYLIVPESFPKIVWDNPATGLQSADEVALTVQWYNADLEPVDRPAAPGRYLADVTGATGDGRKIRRMLTVFCRDPDWMPWREVNRVYPDYFVDSGFDRQAFEANRELVAPLLGRFLQEKMAQAEMGAIINAYWHELRPNARLKSYETPDVVHNDRQVALKRRLLGVDFPPLHAPRTLDQPARVLHAGTSAKAGVTPGAADRLRRVCQEWAEKSGEPFNLLIARHGVVVLHEAFGDCTIDQKHQVASITKSVAGLMFARYLDQGLISLDDPVGRYLPDFPVTGPKAVTMRHLFTHTTGLEGHGEWGGLSNAWLDNVVSLSLGQLPVGKVIVYNGMGYDLAGKVMEFVSGQGIQRVIQEQLWLPLGIEGSSLTDLGYSAMLNAEDIARMGQLLLNQGSYGDRQFFTPATYEKLLPTDLSRYFPEVKQEWGIGLIYLRTKKEPEIAESGYVLSNNLIGHPSATGCILLVDLEHDLIITQSRGRGGKDYDTYYRKLLETTEQVLLDES